MLPHTTIAIKGPTIAVIVNEQSGSGKGQKALYKALQGYLDVVRVYGFSKKQPIHKVVKQAYEQGCRTIVAAGGDGTVSGVASAILEQKLNAKLGVLPIGTLNHFARDINLPKQIDKCLEIIFKGKSTYIDVAQYNNKYFINNSSFGLYPSLVRTRDQVKRRGLGNKWMRAIIASIITFKRHPYVTVEFKKGDEKIVRKTPFVFIGNNTYSLHAGNFGMRERLDEGKLSVFIAHKVSRLGLLTLALHALRGRLKEHRDFDTIGLQSLRITSRKKKLRVAHDGEISKVRTPIRYTIAPKALHVIIP